MKGQLVVKEAKITKTKKGKMFSVGIKVHKAASPLRS